MKAVFFIEKEKFGGAKNKLYADEADSAPVIDSIAATFGKDIFAAGVELIPGNYEASRLRALRLLPYTDGACFDYKGLVRTRTATEPGQIAQIEQFDPAFGVIPALAPFVGKFRPYRANVLWIIASGASSGASDIANAHCISELALALDPNCIDLTRFEAGRLLRRYGR